MDLNYLHPRDEIIEIMNRIYENGMTTTSGGNLSILDDDGSVWITPSAVDKGELSPKDIMRILPDGTIEGNHKPSSEYPFHLAIYKARPDIKAVLHAHPPALVSFSIIREVPDTKIIPNAKDVCGVVGYAPYALPGSEALGKSLADTFAKGHDSVLMENHGIATVGKTLVHAYQRLETLDFCARLTIKGNTLGNVRVLSDSQIDLLKHKENELESFKAKTPTSAEKAIRKLLSKFLKRSYERQLVTSTQGTFSARLENNDFVITPFGLDRKYMEAKDLVLIKDGKREEGKTPSRSVLLHQKIYEEHPEINSILIAHPPNALAFGVCDVKFDTRTIPESYIILKDVPLLPYGTQFMQTETVLKTISKNNPIVICENDCIIVTGNSLLDAFDRLEVAEFTANALISAKACGELIPIGDEEVLEIRKAFLSEE